jgi:hypothetical protein
MTPRFLTILTGRNLPKIRQPREPEPSTINEKTIADFTRVVEQTGILKREPGGPGRNERPPTKAALLAFLFDDGRQPIKLGC